LTLLASEIALFVPPPNRALRPFVFVAGTPFIYRAIAPSWLALGDALIPSIRSAHLESPALWKMRLQQPRRSSVCWV
jgi:hypothetical protein